jgi:hypothetical protein
MDVRPLTENDCLDLLRSDQAFYPSPSPVTMETMSTWYRRNPDFGLVFSEGIEKVGIIAYVPLTMKSCNELQLGRLKESQLQEGALFDRERG